MTERLVLSPVDSSDEIATAIFAIQSDPATWKHLPRGVETDISQSRSLAADNERSWRDLGLGWWVVRLREPLDGIAPDQIVGLGGAAVRRPEVPAWNLGYRLSPAVWGHGFATELSLAARHAAQAAQSELPVTARALSHNIASWRTLERAGLRLVWEGDAGAAYQLTDGVRRRVYSDRELSPDLLDQLIALG